VVEPHPRALARRQRLAVDQHDIVGADIQRRAVDHAPVHADAAFEDDRLAVAARGDAGARHHLGDALGLLDQRGQQLGLGRRGLLAGAPRTGRAVGTGPVEAGLVGAGFVEALGPGAGSARTLATGRKALARRAARTALAIGAGPERARRCVRPRRTLGSVAAAAERLAFAAGRSAGPRPLAAEAAAIATTAGPAAASAGSAALARAPAFLIVVVAHDGS